VIDSLPNHQALATGKYDPVLEAALRALGQALHVQSITCTMELRQNDFLRPIQVGPVSEKV